MNLAMNNDISDNDKELFKHAVKNVIPLKKKNKFNAKKLQIKHVIHKPVSRQQITSIPNLNFAHDYSTANILSETCLSFKRNGISNKQLLDLKNARYGYAAKLDLHGERPEDAIQTINQFIEKHYLLTTKYLLIIHGKGGRDGNPPVIKNVVHDVLRSIPYVLAFHSANPKDGGNGAVYVLLKYKAL